MEKEMDTSKYLSKKNVDCLRGIFAIFVVLHHLYQYTGLLSQFKPIMDSLGYLSVGMFFFFSGYGLMLSSDKEGYLKHFLRCRVLPLYLFYVLLILLYAGWNTMLGGAPTLEDFLSSFLFHKTIVTLGWYFQVQLLIYLIYWVCFHLVKKTAPRMLFMTLALAAYAVLVVCVEGSSLKCEGTVCVLMGMLWAGYKEGIDRLLSRLVWLFLCVGMVLFVGAHYLLRMPMPWQLFPKMLSAISFVGVVLLLTLLLTKTRLIQNPVTAFLGKYSLGIYASQGFILNLRRIHFMEGQEAWFNLLVLGGSIVLGMGFERIYHLIFALFRKKQSTEKEEK